MNPPTLAFYVFLNFSISPLLSSGFHIYICFSFPVKHSKPWASLPVSKDLLSVWGRGGVLGWWAPAWLSLARLHWRLLSTRISYWPKELVNSHWNWWKLSVGLSYSISLLLWENMLLLFRVAIFPNWHDDKTAYCLYSCKWVDWMREKS